MRKVDSLWGETLQELKLRVSRPSLDLFCNNTRPLKIEAGTFYIEVPDETVREHLSLRHSQILKDTLTSLMEKEVSVEFVVGAQSPQKAVLKLPTKPERKPFAPILLNSRYTFDTFVVGQSNSLCHAASVAVSESPGKAYNPLFIYGGVGLGKTHLMHAIGNKIKQNYNSTRIVYITAERFTNELIAAIRTDTTLEFQRKYRSVDVLLIDDIQFLIGKERTQEEFFHTFNTLHEAGRQVVISSDRPPRELSQLEERLTSRFQWGLTADIKPPDYETRMAILQKKIAAEGKSVPEDVIHFIAQSFTQSIRDLEGALTRLFAESLAYSVPIDITLARRALANFYTSETSHLSVEKIIEAVSQYYQVSKIDMVSSKRNKEIALSRQVAMYLARKYGNISLIHIAHACGKKDHTTVMHACEKIEKMVQRDPYIAKAVERLKETLGIRGGEVG